VAEIRQRSKGAAIILLCNCALEQVHADQLDADFFVSKIDPPARMLDIFLKARIWLESRPNVDQDQG
jgi:hypothetical protein